MYKIIKEVTFEAAHHLEMYDGPCVETHGHSYKVEVECRSEGLDEMGMVVDFADIKRIIKDKYDHTNLNTLDEFDPRYRSSRNPTAEALAYAIWEDIALYLVENKNNVKCTRVRVAETDGAIAEFRPTN